MAIKDLIENTRVNEAFLIKSITSGVTTAGSQYYSITFQDKTGVIDGKLWDAKNSAVDETWAGKIVSVTGDVIKYRNTLQIKVLEVDLINDGDISLDNFVMTAKEPLSDLKATIDTTIASFKNKIIKEITSEIINQYQEDFYSYPAAAKVHHDFKSGLVVHVVGMLKMGEFLCSQYPLLNRDLLLAGILLHDIGKTLELSGPVLTEYTVAGKLIGHISMMHAIVYDTALNLGYAESEEALLLRHLILSHHGQLEFGSPVLPLTAEAECLSFIDNLDARLNMLEKALEDLEPGEFTPKLFFLGNRSFYKPTLK